MQSHKSIDAKSSMKQAYKTMSNFRSSRLSHQQRESIAEEDHQTSESMNMDPAKMTRAERVANLSPLNYPGKLQTERFNFGLDAEEREIIQMNKDKISKKAIWELLERKRFQELKKAAINLQGELIVSRRCPRCTLMPPC